MIRVRKPTKTQLIELSSRLRQADRDEIAAASGLAPDKQLLEGLERSTLIWAALRGRQAEAVWGVAPTDNPGVGAVWMMGSDEIARNPREIVKLVPEYVAKMHSAYPALWNFVDARNKLHIKFLRHFNFTFTRLVPQFGVGRLPFWEFIKYV